MPMTREDHMIRRARLSIQADGRYIAADRRDAFLMSNYVAVGGAHHVTMATQGFNVYERMEFDRIPKD